MKNPELYSTESLKKRSDIQMILASYLARDEYVIALINNHPTLKDTTRPIDLLDCLLHDFSEEETFTKLINAANKQLATMPELERIALLDQASKCY